MKRIALFLTLIAAIGCSVTPASVVGKYKGEMIGDASQGSLAAGLQRGIASSMSLELKPDKTFHMVAMVVPVDGTWTLEGDTLTLTPKAVLGLNKSDVNISADRPMSFKVAKGNLEPIDAAGNRFRFLKERDEVGP